MEMIQFSSVVPERENLPYYLITIAWFNNWKAYTGCESQNESDEEIEEPHRGKHPGMINPPSQLRAILDLKYDDKVQYNNDFFDNWHLKRGVKED